MSTTPENDREAYGDYSVDDEGQLQPSDTLADPDVEDTLDRGYSPPERYSAAQGYGNTPWEEAHGEPLAERLRQEQPEPDPYLQAERDGDLDEQGDYDPEAGDERAGRLVDPDQGLGADLEKDLVADDVGIDGAAASAEEAAVHVRED